MSNSILCYKGGKQAIFTDFEVCCTSEAGAAKLHEMTSAFLPYSMGYFSPDFSWKDRIRMRAMVSVKLTIFNQ